MPAQNEGREDFVSFYRSTLIPLRDYLARFMGNRTEAQDIAHDAYLKTYTAMSAQQVAQPRAYLFSAARRLAINFQTRRGSRMVPTEATFLEARAGDTPAPTVAVMLAQDEAAYREAVRQLPHACQQVLVLRLHHGLGPREIAAKLGVSESTATNQLTRAMRLVRDHIASRNAVQKPTPDA